MYSALNIFCKPFYIVLICFFISNICMVLKYIMLAKKNILANNLQIELNKTIKEKELLLKELNHRVKNNLQIIVSLLNIQARICKNPEIDIFIEKAETKIKSMLLVHEMLSVCDDVSKLNFNDYSQDLIYNIFKTLDCFHINFKIQIEPVEFEIETAIPLGLIINETVYNSIKHGFVNKKSGEIYISLIIKNENSYELTISDNGIGFDVNSKKFGSTGLDIVKLLVEQMSGEFQIKSKNGVEIVILFQKP